MQFFLNYYFCFLFVISTICGEIKIFKIPVACGEVIHYCNGVSWQVIRCRHGLWPHVVTISMAVVANLFLIALPLGQGSKVLAAVTAGYLFDAFHQCKY